MSCRNSQIALGERLRWPATLAGLRDEGLDRHEVIHAIGAILMSIFHDVARDDWGRKKVATSDAKIQSVNLPSDCGQLAIPS